VMTQKDDLRTLMKILPCRAGTSQLFQIVQVFIRYDKRTGSRTDTNGMGQDCLAILFIVLFIGNRCTRCNSSFIAFHEIDCSPVPSRALRDGVYPAVFLALSVRSMGSGKSIAHTVPPIPGLSGKRGDLPAIMATEG